MERQSSTSEVNARLREILVINGGRVKDFYLKPAPGKLVRDPVTKQHLTDGENGNGERKPRDSFWLRRVAEGSVVIINPAAVSKAAEKKGGK